MGYKIDSEILLDLIHSELKTFLSPLSCLIPDDNKRRHFEIAIGGIIKKAGELTDAEANSSEKPNNSDTISRQAAVDAVNELKEDGHVYINGDFFETVLRDEVRQMLEELPSAQPERTTSAQQKTGMWMTDNPSNPHESDYCKCSVCGYINCTVEVLAFDGYKYCPNCGARMKEMEEKQNDRN